MQGRSDYRHTLQYPQTPIINTLGDKVAQGPRGCMMYKYMDQSCIPVRIQSIRIAPVEQGCDLSTTQYIIE